jgi:hypothetical protein
MAAAVSVVLIGGVRVGLVRRVRLGASGEAAVSKLFGSLPQSTAARLIVVDAGIATQEQFAAATAHDALHGRLRRNYKLRCAPPPPNGKRGRNPLHGPVLHPGRAEPEVVPDGDLPFPGEGGVIRLRRWNQVHWEGYHQTPVDALRVDDPSYSEPLLVGTTARELTTEERWQAYPHRWPVEMLFYIGAETTATEKPRAWTEQAVERRIGLGLLSGSLKAIAAMGGGLAWGPGTNTHSRVPGGWLTTWRFTSRNYRHLPSRESRRETIEKIPKPLRHRIYSSRKQPEFGKTREIV